MTRTHLAPSGAVLLVLTLVVTFVPARVAQSRGSTLKKIAEFDLPGPGGARREKRPE